MKLACRVALTFTSVNMRRSVSRLDLFNKANCLSIQLLHSVNEQGRRNLPMRSQTSLTLPVVVFPPLLGLAYKVLKLHIVF